MRPIADPDAVGRAAVRRGEHRAADPTLGQGYNDCRPHSALGGPTPDEAWRGVELPRPMRILARDDPDVTIATRREDFHGDRWLPIVNIKLQVRERQAA